MYTCAIFSVSEFEELYKQDDTYDVAHQQFEFCATFSYDHIWVAALALNCTETFLRETGRLQLFSFYPQCEKTCLGLFTCKYVVSVWRGFLFLWVLGMGYVILLWHSLSLPYNYFGGPRRLNSNRPCRYSDIRFQNDFNIVLPFYIDT